MFIITSSGTPKNLNYNLIMNNWIKYFKKAENTIPTWTWTCTLGKLIQEQPGLLLEKIRQKHLNLLVKDFYRWDWWPHLVKIDHCSLSLLLLLQNHFFLNLISCFVRSFLNKNIILKIKACIKEYPKSEFYSRGWVGWGYFFYCFQEKKRVRLHFFHLKVEILLKKWIKSSKFEG